MSRSRKPKTRVYPYPAGADPKKCKRWRVVVDLGTVWVKGEEKRKRITEVFDGGKRGAEGRAAELADQYQCVVPSDLTVGQWLDQWIRDYGCDWKHQTRYSYSRIVKRDLQPALGAIPLQELTPLDVRAFYSALEERGLAANTRLHVHRVLFQALAVAEEAEIIDSNPMRKTRAIKPPTVETNSEKYVLHDQVSRRRLLKLLKARSLTPMTGPGRRPVVDLHVPVVLAMSMGMRRGEVSALTWSDVDLESGVLTVRAAYDAKAPTDQRIKGTKNGKVRTARMPQGTITELKEHQKRQKARMEAAGMEWTSTGFVCADASGDCYHPDAISRSFRAFCDANGFDGALTFHGLRHTNSTTLESLGVGRKVTQKRMGHSSARMTDHYIHASDSDDAKAAAKLHRDLYGPAKKTAHGA